MTQEIFPVVRSFDMIQRRHRSYSTVCCSQCPYFENIPFKGRLQIPPEATVKMMQRKGWIMGHRRCNDICSRCAKRKSGSSRSKAVEHAEAFFESRQH
jgi:hypothetical protein